MTNVLILGGTGWLSGRVAGRWLEEGAAVTCVARGARPAPDGAELVIADRAEPDAYAAVADREWDEIVDISSRAEHVAAAVEALGARTKHWTYVSTISVYADATMAGADESSPLAEPAEPGDEYDYSREKVAAEASARSAVGDRAAIVRAGLIVGPGDPTDRFGYWVSRFALAGKEPVLVPEAAGLMVQVIDVDDLAAYIVAVGRGRWSGTANATGDPIPFTEFVQLARRTAAHTGELVAADPEWLAAHEVNHWMGPRSLPLWLPADMPGHSTRTNAVYRSTGGALRPVSETLARTLDDERARGLDRERQSGLTRAEELALIADVTG